MSEDISDVIMNSDMMRRYSFLIGNPFRSDAEDEELQRLHTNLQQTGNDPGWVPVPRQNPEEVTDEC